MRKLTSVFTLLLVLVLTLTGCAQTTNTNVIPSYKSTDLKNGIFIKRDNRFYPLWKGSNSASADFQWESGKDYLIPHLEPGDELILYSTGKVPQSLTMYSMKDFGYTAGQRFTTDKAGNLIVDSDWCPDSVLQDYWKTKFDSLNDIRVITINGEEFTTKMINSLGFIKGLEANAIYNLETYQGTVYRQVQTKADTHVFIRNREYSLKNYMEMKDIYFVVTLPKNMESGYWMLDGYGMFFLEENVELTGGPLEEIIEGDVDIDNSQEATEELNSIEPIIEIDGEKSAEEIDLENSDIEVDTEDSATQEPAEEPAE